MKRYHNPQIKFYKMIAKYAVMNTSISIHQEVGYPEDAANVGLF